MKRIRLVHLSSQALALAGVAIVLWTSGDVMAAWGMPSERYRREFNAHLADLEMGRVRTLEEVGEKLAFLDRNVPHQWELEDSFGRLVALLAFALLMPIGVGAFTHRGYARTAQDPGASEGLGMLSRVGIALTAVAVVGVGAALWAAGGSRSEAGVALRAARESSGDSALRADFTREAFAKIRDGNRGRKTASVAALTLVGFAFALGLILHVFGSRLVLRAAAPSDP